MATKKFSLGIEISALDKVTKPLAKIQDKIRKVGDNIESKKSFMSKSLGIPALKKSFSDLGNSLKPIGVAFAAVGAIGVAAFMLIKGSAEKLDNLGDLSKTIGMNVKSIQEWRYAASQMGSSSEEMDEGLKTFTLGMGKARAGGGKMLGFMKQVNPAFAKQLLATKSNEEGFELMMNAMVKITDPQKKLAFATAAFGTAGESLARVSGEGAEKMKAMREEAAKLGLATQEDTEVAGSFNDGMAKMMFSLDAVKNKIAAKLMPILTQMFERITNWVANNQDKIDEFANMLGEMLPAAIEYCANAFNSIVNSPITKTIIWLIGKIGVVNIVIGVLAAFIAGTLISVLSSLVTLLTALGVTFTGTWLAALGPIGLVIAGIAAVIAIGYALYSYWDDICDLFKNVWGWVSKIVGANWDKLKNLFGFSTSKSTETVKNIETTNGKSVPPPGGLGANQLGAQSIGKEYFDNGKTNSETEIKINFDNMPKGTRVETEKNKNSSLDLTMGYSMVSP